jgi:hypothetical protein
LRLGLNQTIVRLPHRYSVARHVLETRGGGVGSLAGFTTVMVYRPWG